jgi:hypothetical protein
VIKGEPDRRAAEHNARSHGGNHADVHRAPPITAVMWLLSKLVLSNIATV